MDYKVNDYEIIYMVRENDDMARNRMIQKYLPIIKRIAIDYYQQFKVYGAELDDFIQEGMIAFNKAIDTYNENKNIKFYTFSILCVRRRLITFCRNISSNKNQILNNSIRDENIYLNLKEEFKEEFLQKEIFIKLKNSLKMKFSLVFELRYNGFSYEEIARLLDIPLSTVDSRISIIKSNLHKLKEKTT